MLLKSATVVESTVPFGTVIVPALPLTSDTVYKSDVTVASVFAGSVYENVIVIVNVSPSLLVCEITPLTVPVAKSVIVIPVSPVIPKNL